MTIDDLKNVRRQKLRVEALQERIERLRSRAEYTQQQLGECGRSDPTRDRLAEHVAELDGLERQLTGEMITGGAAGGRGRGVGEVAGESGEGVEVEVCGGDGKMEVSTDVAFNSNSIVKKLASIDNHFNLSLNKS